MSENEINVPAVKIVTAWAAVGITSWADAASFLAFVYTFALLSEWVWKKVARPFLVTRGYLPELRRREDDD